MKRTLIILSLLLSTSLSAQVFVTEITTIAFYSGPFSPGYYEMLRMRRVYRPLRMPVPHRRPHFVHHRRPPVTPEPATVAMLLGAGALVSFKRKGRECV